MTTELESLKKWAEDYLEKTKTFTYQSPIGPLHATGIREGEQIALRAILRKIEEMEESR